VTPARAGFGSPLATYMQSFLDHKRVLGRKYISEQVTLRLFDQFLLGRRVSQVQAVTPKVVDAFLASRPRPSPRSYNQLLGMLRLLFAWMVVRGHIERSPVHAHARRGGRIRSPVILAPEHVKRLLKLASRMRDTHAGTLRANTYATAFALLYALGLRIGEACRLCFADVDWGRRLLIIRQSKFGKSRLVPFGPRLGHVLKIYVDARTAQYGSMPLDAPVLSVAGTRPLTRQKIGGVFRQFRSQIGIALPLGASLARIHDLRASFAVRTLLRWYRSGIDPAGRLLALSTFMGHVQPESTAVYLTITGELLHVAGARFESLADPLLVELSP